MKSIRLIIGFLALATSAFAQTASINLYVGTLLNASGQTAADNGVFILVADTNNNGFSSLNSSTVFSTGNFLSVGSDDYIAAAFKIDSSTSGLAGTTIASLTLDYAAGIVSQGDALQLYWIPSVTSFGSTAVTGTAYGSFTNSSAILTGDDTSIAWIAPSANPSAYTLTFATISAGGSYANTEGLADQTVAAAVPEPATTVAILGGVAGVFVLLRRRKQKLALAA